MTKFGDDVDDDANDNEDDDNDDLCNRWSILAWPHKLERQVEATQAQYLEDEERFKKLQVLDQTSFADRIDSLTVISFSHTQLSPFH